MKRRSDSVSRRHPHGFRESARAAGGPVVEVEGLEPRLLMWAEHSTPNVGSGTPVVSAVDQANGYIYVATEYNAGSSNFKFQVTRFNSGGSIDTSWGSSGNVRFSLFGTSTPEEDSPLAIAVNSTGSEIAVVGESSTIGWAVGIVDSSGTTTNYPSTLERGQALAVSFDHSGDLLVAGGNNGDNMVVARLELSGGTLQKDTSFGTGGIDELYDTGDSAYAEGVFETSDTSHDILVAGYTSYSPGGGSASDFTLVRLADDGSYYSSWGNYDSSHATSRNNFASCNPNACVTYSDDVAYGLTEWDDTAGSGNKYVYLAGVTDATGNSDFAITRYNLSDGSLDTTWGFTNGNGQSGELIGHAGTAKGIVMNGSNFLIAGNDATDYIIDQYESDGSLDTGWQTSGQVGGEYGGSGSSDVEAVSSDGTYIYISGRHTTTGGHDVGLAKIAM